MKSDTFTCYHIGPLETSGLETKRNIYTTHSDHLYVEADSKQLKQCNLDDAVINIKALLTVYISTVWPLGSDWSLTELVNRETLLQLFGQAAPLCCRPRFVYFHRQVQHSDNCSTLDRIKNREQDFRLYKSSFPMLGFFLESLDYVEVL